MNISIEQQEAIVGKLNRIQTIKDNYNNGLIEAIQKGDSKTIEFFDEIIRRLDAEINGILFCLGVLNVEVSIKACGERGIFYKLVV